MRRAIVTAIVRLRRRNGGACCTTASSNSLVERALAASPTLEIALDRLQQARAQELVVIGAALPVGRVDRRRGLGHRQRSRAWSRFANSHLRGNRRWRRASGQSCRLRRRLGARYFRQVPARASRQRNTMSTRQSPPAMSCWYRSSPMSFAPTSICARSRWSLRSYAKISRWRASTSISSRNAISRGITNELDVTLAQRELAHYRHRSRRSSRGSTRRVMSSRF